MRLICLLLCALAGAAPGLPRAGAAAAGVRREAAKPLSVRVKIDSLEIEERSATTANVRLKVTLELVNTGDRPVIVLSQPPTLVGLELARTPEDFAAGRRLLSTYAGPAVSLAPEWGELRAKLSREQPPSEHTRVIPPGGSWSFAGATGFTVSNMQDYTGRLVRWDELRREGAVSMRLIFEFWPLNLEPGVKRSALRFGRQLQRKWRKLGLLWLDDLLSEPATLRLDGGSTGRALGGSPPPHPVSIRPTVLIPTCRMG
jgi:hypothetical protein